MSDAELNESPLEWPPQCAPDDVIKPSPAGAALQRLAKLTTREMTEAQRESAARISAGPRGCLFGPFSILHRSPELLDRVQMLGEFIRFNSTLPLRIREFGMLVTGRKVEAPYIWYIHLPIALRAGVEHETAVSLAKNERPVDLRNDEAAVYDLFHDLHETNSVRDEVYSTAVDCFGEAGVVELVALDGYLTLIGRELNMARFPVPESVNVPFKAPWEKVM